MEILTQQIYHYSPRANDYIDIWRIEWTDGYGCQHATEARTYSDAQVTFINLKFGKGIDGRELKSPVEKADTIKCFYQKKDRVSKIVVYTNPTPIFVWSLNQAQTHHSIVC